MSALPSATARVLAVSINYFASHAPAAADAVFVPSTRSMHCRPSFMRIDDALDYARVLLLTLGTTCGKIVQLQNCTNYLIPEDPSQKAMY